MVDMDLLSDKTCEMNLQKQRETNVARKLDDGTQQVSSGWRKKSRASARVKLAKENDSLKQENGTLREENARYRSENDELIIEIVQLKDEREIFRNEKEELKKRLDVTNENFTRVLQMRTEVTLQKLLLDAVQLFVRKFFW